MTFECPLDVHCSYTRDRILVAYDHQTLEKPDEMEMMVKVVMNCLSK